MTNKNMMDLYAKQYTSKEYTSVGLFRTIKEKFNIQKAFYPGCYVHVTPSLIFSDVTYADSFRKTDKFFESDEVLKFVVKNKEYEEKPKYKFFHQDYYKPFEGLTQEFDLIISQYAGFVGQAVKEYLKSGGILVCNNSHGDASMASLDPNYKLVAVYRRKSDDNFSISSKNLETYLIPKNGIEPTVEKLKETMRGIAYTKSPSGYIFEKIG